MSSWQHAAALGLAASMRTFSPLGVHALRGGLRGRPRRVALALAGGELVYDKLPFARPRTEAEGLFGRTAVGLVGGYLLADRPGAAVGAACGFAGAFGCMTLRGRIGAPATAVALAEDALSLGLATYALRAA